MTELEPTPTRAVLESVLSAAGFTPFERALDDLASEDAVRRPDGSPHSVAEVVAHMVFWQERFVSMVDGHEPATVPQASIGWPSVEARAWPGLVKRFLAGLARYRELAADEANLGRVLLEGHTATVGSGVLHYYLHDVHHLGQVILLRRMIGAWPPPGGGDSW